MVPSITLVRHLWIVEVNLCAFLDLDIVTSESSYKIYFWSIDDVQQ
jgi:hypothetical protein